MTVVWEAETTASASTLTRSPGSLVPQVVARSVTLTHDELAQIIAAERTDRRCRAIEISPPFVDVAIRRWEKATGQEATLEGDGRTFAEVAVERGVS